LLSSSSQRLQLLHPPAQQSINPSIHQSILQLARVVGIQTSYIDTSGKRQYAAPETLTSILELWGIAAHTQRQICDALSLCGLNHWQRNIEPVIVAWDGRRPKIELRIPAAHENQLANCALRFESGQSKSFTVRLNTLRTFKRSRISGLSFVAKELSLPAISLTHHTSCVTRPATRNTATLPHGYHRLEIEIAGQTATALIISAPTKSYSDPTLQKSWGAFLPMYAAHSRESWGAGNFGDWQKLSEWIASLGGRVVSTLPLLATFLDHPVCEPSPYSPASRLFWSEFYLNISAIPELSRCKAAQRLLRSARFQRQLERFRASSLIDYPAEMAARRQVLEKLARSFFEMDSARRVRLSRFLRERPLVEDYARFRAVCDHTNHPWQKWPQRLRDGNLQSGDYSEATKNYHLYIQWRAHEQIAALTKNCRACGVQFYLDLPLGVHPAGYDLWRERDAFAMGTTVGAPPDAFFSKGQNWGFAPLHPQRLREQGYRYLRDVLRFQMRHTGMLRLDHVMSLHRLYWIPRGHSAREGAYVSYPAEELYAILSLESHRHKTLLVGENLGTVPDEVNEAMTRHGLRRMYVVQFAQRPNPRAALAKPPLHSVASLNTHDMPTFAAHWRGLDIDDRVKLGLFTKAEAQKEYVRRANLNLALARYLVRNGWLPADPDLSFVTSVATKDREPVAAILRACLAWLRASSADLVLINLEDLWQEKLPQNTPGTSRERPNWRRKARFTIGQIQNDAQLSSILRDSQGWVPHHALPTF
jgi:4-alpha-glucanotransferase